MVVSEKPTRKKTAFGTSVVVTAADAALTEPAKRRPNDGGENQREAEPDCTGRDVRIKEQFRARKQEAGAEKR